MFKRFSLPAVYTGLLFSTLGSFAEVFTGVMGAPDARADEVKAGSAQSRPSAPQISLSDALSHTLKVGEESSFSVKKANSVQRSAAARSREAFSYFLPTVNVNANHLLGSKYVLTDIVFAGATTPTAVPQILSNTQYNVNAQWWILDAYANLKRYGGGSKMAKSAENDRLWARFKAERELKLAFYQALTQRELIHVAEENRNALKEHREDAKRFLSVGSSTKYDLLRVESQLSQGEVEVLSAEDLEQNYRAKFFELMGVADQGLSLSGSLPIISEKTIHTVEGTLSSGNADTGRADLVALTEKVDSLDSTWQASQLHWSPHVGLFYQYTIYNNRSEAVWNAADNRQAYQYGVNLSWTIFDGFSSTSRATQNGEEKVQAEIMLDQTRLQMKQDQELWRRRFQTAVRLVEARTTEVEKAQEAERIARVGRRAGTITQTQILDAEVELFRAKAGLVNARYSEIESLVKLELATGKTFEVSYE